MRHDIKITEFFEKELKAPLVNHHWSWGAVMPDEDAVILRAWKDQSRHPINGKRFWKILDTTHDRTSEAGYNERVRHIEAIRQGAKCFIVEIEAVDAQTNERKIKKFTKGNIWVGGELLLHEGNWFIEVLDPIPLHEFKKRGA